MALFQSWHRKAHAPLPTLHASPPKWWQDFHVHALAHLVHADGKVERRELVWIKGFFLRHHAPLAYDLLLAEVSTSDSKSGIHDAAAALQAPQWQTHAKLARTRLGPSQKQRLVYDLAQMCKAKGEMTENEYSSIIDLAQAVGLDDVEADGIIHSVYSINDTFLAIVGILALGTMVYLTRGVIVPLVIALFVTMVIAKLEAVVSQGLRLNRLPKLRGLTRLIAFVGVLGSFFVLGSLALESGRAISERLPFYQGQLIATFERVDAFAQGYGFDLLNRAGIGAALSKLPLADLFNAVLGGLFSLIADFFLVTVFSAFLLFTTQGTYRGVLQEMNEKITAYISVKTGVSLITGLGVWGVCTGFGVDFALFWGILALLLNFIPTVGSVIATVPPVLLALVQFATPTVSLGVLAGLAAVQMVMGQMIEPKLMGDRLEVHPVAVVLGLVFWGFLWGLPGAFLAAPLMALLRILASHFNFSRGFERLLAGDGS